MYQQVTIIGNLGQNPEERITPTGRAVCNFSVATNRRWTAKSGNKQQQTTWFKVAAWGAIGEACMKHLAQGRLVHIVGPVTASAWTGKDGIAKVSLEVTAKRVDFLGGKDAFPSGDALAAAEEIPF